MFGPLTTRAASTFLCPLVRACTLVFAVDLAASTSCFLEFGASSEFLVLFLGLHDLLVVHLDLLFLFLLHLDGVIHLKILVKLFESASKQISLLHPLQSVLTEIKLSIFPDTEGVLMPVDTSIIQIKSLRFLNLCVLPLLDKVVCHQFCVTARTANHAGLTIVLLLIVVFLQRLIPHAL